MYLLVLFLLSPAFGRPSSDHMIRRSLDGYNGDQFDGVLNNSEFNKAMSYVREARQVLKKLAERTVTDVNDLKILLEALDENFIDRMMDHMKETIKSLEEAKEKYRSALITFDNLGSQINVARQIVRRAGMNWNNIDPTIKVLFENGNNFENTIKVLVQFLSEELDLLNDQIRSSQSVISNLDGYMEHLRKYQTIRIVAMSGLDDLKNAAETFLTQPSDTQNALDLLYRQYLDKENALRMNVGENLLEAEKNILEVSALKHAVEDQYLAYNEAKWFLKKTRQELRELADSTWTKVRDLKLVLENLDESNNTLFFKIFINRLKDMRIDPVEMLKESRATYESAVKTFENTKSFIATKIRELERASVSSKVTESGQNFEKTLEVLIDILGEEIEMITIWTKSAKTVSRNIDNNSEEHLRQFGSVKTIFINGLDDLENATNTFLDQQMEIIKLKE